jgi:hypothetical protein
VIIEDSLAILEQGMRFFYKEFIEAKDEDKVGRATNIIQACKIAKDVAPYRHPTLASVKLAATTTTRSWCATQRRSQRFMPSCCR